MLLLLGLIWLLSLETEGWLLYCEPGLVAVGNGVLFPFGELERVALGKVGLLLLLLVLTGLSFGVPMGLTSGEFMLLVLGLLEGDGT